MANAIAERSTRMIYKNAITSMEQTETYRTNSEFRAFMEEFGSAIKQVTTIYPYIYHSVSVDDQKNCLNELGWLPPNRMPLDKYISSGCRIMRGLIYELEKIGIVTLNEREQAKMMVQQGLMNSEQLAFAEEDVSRLTVNLGTEEIKRLGLVEYLEAACVEKRKAYIK